MAKAKDETALAPVGSTAVTKGVDLGTLADDAGAYGMAFDKQDLALPFLRVIQSNSPQIDQYHEQYIADAKPGMLFNTATRELWDGQKGVTFLPVTYQRAFIEWRPREQGGGFIKDHGADGEALLKTTRRNDKNKDILPNGNELSTTALYYGYVVNPMTGSFQQVAFVLGGTQLKKSRKWNVLLDDSHVKDPATQRKIPVPPFYFLYRITTVPEKNEKGNWLGIRIDQLGNINDIPEGEQLYARAKKMYELVSQGAIKTQEPPAPDDEDSETF